MSKRVILDKIDTNSDGVLHIRFQKQLIDDVTGEIISFEYHRTSCEPFVNIDTQIAFVEADLARVDRGSWPNIEVADKTVLKDVAKREQTVARKNARRIYYDNVTKVQRLS